jgi:hypothetical protein
MGDGLILAPLLDQPGEGPIGPAVRLRRSLSAVNLAQSKTTEAHFTDASYCRAQPAEVDATAASLTGVKMPAVELTAELSRPAAPLQSWCAVCTCSFRIRRLSHDG